MTLARRILAACLLVALAAGLPLPAPAAAGDLACAVQGGADCCDAATAACSMTCAPGTAACIDSGRPDLFDDSRSAQAPGWGAPFAWSHARAPETAPPKRLSA